MRIYNSTRRSFLLGAASIILGAASLAGPALAQTSERVKFAAGNDNAAVSGKVTGHGYKDYILGARAGQKMGVSLIGSAYFNILPPGSSGEAIYNSSMNGNDATNVVLPKTGDYTIRVYLMGAAESEGKTVPYQLSFVVM